MKYLLLLALWCIISMPAIAQPYAVGHTSTTFTDSARANRQVTVDIYYPAQTAGNNVPVVAGQFPLISFGHGFVMVSSAYDNIWLNLVPRGYIMMFPTTESGFSPVHADFGADLAFLINKLKAESATNTSSLFYGHAATTSAIMGHSMGAGSSFLAAAGNSGITTMVTLAAATTNPSSITAAPAVTVPALVIAGQNDCVAPPATNQVPHYDSLGSACKAYLEVKGGGHCFFANTNVNCSFGEGTCQPTPTITRAEQQDAAQDVMVLWLDHFLKDSMQAWTALTDTIANSQRYNALLNCSPTAIAEAKVASNIEVYPNPVVDILNVLIKTADNTASTLEVFDVRGSKVLSRKLSARANTATADVSMLTAGFYLCRLSKGVEVKWFKIVKE